MLILTGQRRTEVAQARWSEISAGLWVIPASRYKTGVTHSVPIVPELQRVLDGISRDISGFIFTSGRGPIAAFSKAKRRIDAELKFSEPWGFHAVRRTV